MQLGSNRLCGRSLRGTDDGQICAQPQLAGAEARASNPEKPANRVSRFRCSREELARAETAGRFRFAAQQVLPNGRARIEDRAEPHRPRTARWILPVAQRSRRRRCSRAVGRGRGGSRTHRVSPGTPRVEEFLRQIFQAKRPLRSPCAPNRAETVDRFQRGMASSDFLWLSIMRSLRRCLIRSSSWPQNFRKY